MKFILFLIVIIGLIGCTTSNYPKLRDVPADVKPTLSFKEAQQELKDLAQERDAIKGD